MAAETKISWAHSTLNYWIGCTKVSAACDHCYAEREWADRKHRVEWGPHGDRSPTKTWPAPYKWQREAAAFFAEHGERRRVFVNSLSDFGDNHRSILPAWRAEAHRAWRECPDLDFLILTKRPQNLAKPGYLPADWSAEAYPNVWLGTTVENQEEADRRCPELRAIPARIRFLSMEPLLGPVDVRKHLWPACGWWRPPHRSYAEAKAAGGVYGMKPQALISASWAATLIHLLLVGGESGPGARHFDEAWARDLLEQTRNAGALFHMKQLSQADYPKTFKDFEAFPPDLQVREVPS